MLKGLIVKNISDDYTVSVDNHLYVCKSRGKFRNKGITPVVGDWVIFDEEKKYIHEIESRKNELKRPVVANIDQAIIITSVKEPNFSTNLLDKLLVIIEYNKIEPIICLTKLDLLNEEEMKTVENYIKYYKQIGYRVYTNDKITSIKKIFKDKVSVLTGQSGAGKSSLLNRLNPNLNLKTNEISKALGRGKHTTRHVELIPIYGGLVADTPGFSALDLTTMTKEEIRDNFIEFNKNKDKCRYNDCMHIKEESCEIKKMVTDNKILKSRYENYLKFLENR